MSIKVQPQSKFTVYPTNVFARECSYDVVLVLLKLFNLPPRHFILRYQNVAWTFGCEASSNCDNAESHSRGCL